MAVMGKAVGGAQVGDLVVHLGSVKFQDVLRCPGRDISRQVGRASFGREVGAETLPGEH